MLRIEKRAQSFSTDNERSFWSFGGCQPLYRWLLVYGRTLAEHNRRLQQVFRIVRDCGLRLNRAKCVFAVTAVKYCGFEISERGVRPDPERIQPIVNWPEPANITELERFVQTAGYFRKYIPQFATLAEPIYRAREQGLPLTWSPELKHSFDGLRKALCEAPALQIFDPAKLVQLETDASGVGLRAILTQNGGQPIAFASRTLTKQERLLGVTQLEALAIVWAVEHFRSYLLGRHFDLLTDHLPCKYLFGELKPSAKLQRWRLMLSEYSFSIHYRPGAQNRADGLSRSPCTLLCGPSIDQAHYRANPTMYEHGRRTCSTSKIALPRTST